MANFKVNVSDLDRSTDAQAIRYFVKLHNSALNEEDKLDTRPLKALERSYEKILATALERIHSQNLLVSASHSANVNKIQKRWKLSTDEQRAAALEALAPLNDPSRDEPRPELGSPDDPSSAREPSI